MSGLPGFTREGTDQVVDLNARTRKKKDWEWVCSALLSKDHGECNAQMLDMLVMEGGVPVAWLFTNRTGTVMRKNAKSITLNNVVNHFCKTAGAFSRNTEDYTAVLWRGNAVQCEILTKTQMLDFFDQIPRETCTLHTYVQPRGELDTSRFSNFEIDYKLSSDGRCQYRCTKLATGKQRIPSMDIHVNKTMEGSTAGLVALVEKVKKCRVVSMTCRFVADDHGNSYLSRATTCDIIPNTVQRRAKRAVRRRSFGKVKDEGYVGPSAMSERVNVREHRESLFIPDELEVQRIMTNKKQSKGMIKSHSVEPLPQNSTPLSGSRASFMDRRVSSAAHLGSSQHNGCCGDYCDFLVEAHTNSHAKDSHALARASLSPKELKRIVSQNTTTNLGSRGTPSSQASRSSLSSAESSGDFHKIAFKDIAQARVEKAYVDLFIRRYRNNEEGDYLNDDYIAECGDLGESFPGHYYRQVNVCPNCYQLYQLIDEARAKAKAKIAAKKRRHSARPDLVSTPSRSPSVASYGRGSSRTPSSAAIDNVAVQTILEAPTESLSSMTKNDLAEFRSFSSPPPAVVMVSTVLMELLLARSLSWFDAKRVMAQGDKFITSLVTFDLDRLTPDQVVQAFPYVRNPLFNPESIKPVNASAAKLSTWILTTLRAYALKHGDKLVDPDMRDYLLSLNPDGLAALPPPSVLPSSPLLVEARNALLSAEKDSHIESVEKKAKTKKKSTKKELEIRKAIQNQQMSRLAQPHGNPEAHVSEEDPKQVYTCADGKSSLTYAVVGQSMLNSTKPNLVVFHDFFDTHEATQIVFRSFIAKHTGCQALFLNYPGQANTSYPSSDDEASGGSKVPPSPLNNHWLCERIAELFQHLNDTGEFITNGLPHVFVGFGNGANLAACYSLMYATAPAIATSLKAMVLVNGFAHLDAQFAAIVHSAINVFSCFPVDRPDLPISYFTKFLFSDRYLKKVDINLALNIYTAVTNPITLDGRIRLLQGTLHHVDLQAKVAEVKVPLVLLQSIENQLVNPSNADAFLKGRECNHVWSHQQAKQATGLTEKAREQLQQTLRPKDETKTAFAMWVKAGHEIRQEGKRYLIDVLEVLMQMNPNSSKSPAQVQVKPKKHKIETTSVPLEEAQVVPLNMIPQNHREMTASGGLRKADSAKSIATPPATVHFSTPIEKTKPSKAPEAPKQVSISTSKESSEEEAKFVSMEKTIQKAFTPEPIVVMNQTEFDQTEREFERAMEAHRNQKRLELTKQKTKAIEEPREVYAVKDEDYETRPVEIPLQPQPSSIPVDAHAHTKAALLAEPVAAASTLTAATRPEIPKVLENVEAVTQVPLVVHRSDFPTKIEDTKHKLEKEQKRYEREQANVEVQNTNVMKQQLDELRREQEERMKKWQSEDDARLAQLDKELYGISQQRVLDREQREQEIEEQEKKMTGLVHNEPPCKDPSKSTLEAPSIAPSASALVEVALAEKAGEPKVKEKPNAPIAPDAEVTGMAPETFDQVNYELDRAYEERQRKVERAKAREDRKVQNAMATRIQARARGNRDRERLREEKLQREYELERLEAASVINRHGRGYIGRKKFKREKHLKANRKRYNEATLCVQKHYRGYVVRTDYKAKLQEKKTRQIQRMYRGHKGRQRAAAERKNLVGLQKRHESAAKIQAAWKMRVARDQFLETRVYQLAALEIQRTFRGHSGRKMASRKRTWKNSEPGPERLALGLSMIEESKKEYEKQQQEIDALHRAQEQAEKHVSEIHVGLKESEKELAILEKELQDIDQLEVDLHELTSEAELLHAQGAHPDDIPIGSGVPGEHVPANYSFESKEEARKRQAEKYAVEMAIHLKRTEREKKKKELEAEFTNVFKEVEEKRNELAKLEARIGEMEATRIRKDREFGRLQRNLMELIDEQKYELEMVREKGIELETAVATSAAAAAATAAKQKENQKRSQAMYASTEELMKFQFMSMSITYLSSLNMVKSLRDLDEDTSKQAVAGAASTAAAAAAAAAAANIPTMQNMKLNGTEMMDAETRRKKRELEKKKQEEQEAKEILNAPFPEDVKDWTVDDVGRWLKTLSLGQYLPAFKEAAVDGEFLLELRPEDMSEVLGMTHRLHVRKVVVARNKLLPLSEREVMQRDAVLLEESANATREDAAKGIPDLDTAFSQARNGRLKRLVASLEAGFDVNSEDEKGNSLLLVACQQCNLAMAEALLTAGANINHQNAAGNTALHYAMAYDKEGTIGEFLIEHGADDTLENESGLSPYDGLG